MASVSQRTPGEESITSPGAGYFERRSEDSPGFALSPRDAASQGLVPVRRCPAYVDGVRSDSTRHLPPLADMFDNGPTPSGIPHLAEAPVPTLGVLPRGHETVSPIPPTPSTSGSDCQRPSLRKEQSLSSAGSLSSGSSAYNSSHPRTPIDGPLPIHALLTGTKQHPPYDSTFAANPVIQGAIQGRSMSPDDTGPPRYFQSERTSSDPGVAGLPMPHINGRAPFLAPHVRRCH